MLQIFTYSTGLALTGRSAACAPATATRPAAEPRRRLFTIFIVTSKFVNRGRVPLFGCRSTLEGPLQFPAKPPGPLFLTTAVRSVRTRTGRPGDAPLRRVFNLSHGTCTHNEKTAESQGSRARFQAGVAQMALAILRPNEAAEPSRTVAVDKSLITCLVIMETSSRHYDDRAGPIRRMPGLSAPTALPRARPAAAQIGRRLTRPRCLRFSGAAANRPRILEQWRRSGGEEGIRTLDTGFPV